jgi:hypothetical protein
MSALATSFLQKLVLTESAGVAALHISRAQQEKCLASSPRVAAFEIRRWRSKRAFVASLGLIRSLQPLHLR